MKKSIGQIQLEKEGFSKVENHRRGKWFTSVAPNGEEVCFLRQGSDVWHAFFLYVATGSGRDPTKALTGGLGAVIDHDRALRSYSALVRNAPPELVHKFAGLYEATLQVR